AGSARIWCVLGERGQSAVKIWNTGRSGKGNLVSVTSETPPRPGSKGETGTAASSSDQSCSDEAGYSSILRILAKDSLPNERFVKDVSLNSAFLKSRTSGKFQPDSAYSPHARNRMLSKNTVSPAAW